MGQVIADCEEEAVEIVADARHEASREVGDAEEEAMSLIQDAKKDLDAKMKQLEDTETILTDQPTSLLPP